MPKLMELELNSNSTKLCLTGWFSLWEKREKAQKTRKFLKDEKNQGK